MSNDSIIPNSSIVIYHVNTSTQLPVAFDSHTKTVWLNQRQIATLFDLNQRTVSEHIQNFKRDAGSDDSGYRKFRCTAEDDKSYLVEHYNLEVITYIGYRAQATPLIVAFRKWVAKTLQTHIETKPASLLDTLETMIEEMRNEEARIVALEFRSQHLIRHQSVIDKQLEEIKERLDNAEYMTISQYCSRQKLNVTNSIRAQWGKDAVSLSHDRQLPIYDTFEGSMNVGRYHESVLQAVCVITQKPNQLRLLKDN